MLNLKKSVVDIALVCSDFDHSVNFYRNQLGLETVLDFNLPEETAISAGLAPRGFRQIRFQLG